MLETISITIEGTTPLILNKFTDAAQLAASAGSRSSVNGDRGKVSFHNSMILFCMALLGYAGRG